MDKTVTWYVDDGYVRPGPQETKIECDDEEWERMTENEKENYIDEAIKQDFDERISWFRG